MKKLCDACGAEISIGPYNPVVIVHVDDPEFDITVSCTTASAANDVCKRCVLVELREAIKTYELEEGLPLTEDNSD